MTKTNIGLHFNKEVSSVVVVGEFEMLELYTDNGQYGDANYDLIKIMKELNFLPGKDFIYE